MIGYFNLFPNKCETELRTARFVDDHNEGIPSGTYVFSEYYCDDLSCDCQRVLVKVLRVERPEDMPQDVASISFSWNENPDETWADILEDEDGPFLDPFHRQCDYANDLLDFWHDMVRRDSDYLNRLKRHYSELRNHVGTVPRPHFGSSRPDEFDVALSVESVEERKRRHRSLRQRNTKRKSRPK